LTAHSPSFLGVALYELRQCWIFKGGRLQDASH
jgi:hypothetical protein